MTRTEELKVMITQAGGDISSLPDNLETTLYKALCETLGIDYSEMDDNLASSYLKKITEDYTGGGGSDQQWIEKTLTEVSSEDATKVGNYTFYFMTYLKRANLPNAESLSEYAFYGCRNLEEVIVPNIKTIGNRCFSGNSTDKPLLTVVDAPLVESIGTNCFQYSKALTSANYPLLTKLNNYVFGDCSALSEVHLPNITSVGNSALLGTAVEILDFPKVTSIGSQAFQSCSKLKLLVLRAEQVVSLSNYNAFKYTLLETNNGASFNVLVPSSVKSKYPSATNWSTFPNYTVFKVLEDYTVDGTATGELDPEKIAALLG